MRVVVESPCEHGMVSQHSLYRHKSYERSSTISNHGVCAGGSRRVLTPGEFVLVEKVDGEWSGWVVKSDPKTWRYCPICGRRNREAAVPELVEEMGEHLADFTFCSPSNCDAWKVTATFDHDTREWIAVDVLAVGEGS